MMWVGCDGGMVGLNPMPSLLGGALDPGRNTLRVGLLSAVIACTCSEKPYLCIHWSDPWLVDRIHAALDVAVTPVPHRSPFTSVTSVCNGEEEGWWRVCSDNDW